MEARILATLKPLKASYATSRFRKPRRSFGFFAGNEGRWTGTRRSPADVRPYAFVAMDRGGSSHPGRSDRLAAATRPVGQISLATRKTSIPATRVLVTSADGQGFDSCALFPSSFGRVVKHRHWASTPCRKARFGLLVRTDRVDRRGIEALWRVAAVAGQGKQTSPGRSRSATGSVRSQERKLLRPPGQIRSNA